MRPTICEIQKDVLLISRITVQRRQFKASNFEVQTESGCQTTHLISSDLQRHQILVVEQLVRNDVDRTLLSALVA